MYIESVPNRNSPPAVLLRESYRDAGKVKKRTLANLSQWPPALIQGLRTLLKGGHAVSRLADAFDIVRTLPHGHVAAVLGTLRKLKLDRLIASQPCEQRDRVLAMIVARILNPGSKLATARGLASETARDSLAETLCLGDCDENDLYAAMNWLLTHQDAIEQRLAKRHLDDGALVLYDLTSVYLEGRSCPLAKRGHSRDGKRGKLQIEFGLLCNAKGCPVAVEVFDGNTADPVTVGVQIDKLRRRFGLSRVVLVGDRGMLTEARIREEVEPAGLDWISALRGPAVRALVESGSVQLSLFDQVDLIEIRSPEYPGERLMVCRNPLLAEQRKRKREELLQATEALFDPIVAATLRDKRRLKGKENIALRVGKVIGKYKMAKHFDLEFTEESFGYQRNPESIAREAALDGLYIVRTSLPADELDACKTVSAYKSLSQVERAFRSFKTVDLKVRPIFHYDADRVRVHILLCILAYYVEWHMRQSLAPLLFDDDDDRAGAEAARTSVVAPARVSQSAQAKARSKRTTEDWPVHSFIAVGMPVTRHPPAQIRTCALTHAAPPSSNVGKQFTPLSDSAMPHGSRSGRQLCAVRVLAREFLLGETLPSPNSAGTLAPLFAGFDGTMISSDFSDSRTPRTFTSLSVGAQHYYRRAFRRPPRSRCNAYKHAWVLGHRGTPHTLAFAVVRVLPSTCLTASASQIIAFSVLISPTYLRPCQRLAVTLTSNGP